MSLSDWLSLFKISDPNVFFLHQNMEFHDPRGYVSLLLLCLESWLEFLDWIGRTAVVGNGTSCLVGLAVRLDWIGTHWIG